MLPTDYYATLGVPHHATESDIRKSYRRLVRQWHPDLNPDVLDAEDRLKRLNEAYGVLRDPHARRVYDHVVLSVLSSTSSGGAVRVPRRTLESRRSLASLAASFAAVLIVMFLCLSGHSTMGIPSEWRDVSRVHITGTSFAPQSEMPPDQLEGECRWVAQYWERELQMNSGSGIARSRLATVYLQLAAIAAERGDKSLARTYVYAAHYVAPRPKTKLPNVPLAHS